MRKIKLVLTVLIITLLLSGCTVRSEVTVAPNGKTTENVQILTDTSTFESDAYSKEEMIEFSMEQHLAALNYRDYSYETIVGDDLSGAEMNKTYDNICSYFQDTLFNQYVYHHMNCIENDYYYEISNDTEYIPYCSDCSDWPALNDIEFKITLPIKAEEQNADEIDGNTYIWRYDENTRDKSFYLKISKSALEQSEVEYNANVSRKKTINTMLVVVGVVALLAIIGFVGVVLYKKYQRNKLDY